MKTIFSNKAFKIIAASIIFAAAFVLSVVFPMNLGSLDNTAIVEISFVLGLGAVAGFSELFCIITGFSMTKCAALSIALSAVLTVIRTFENWFTYIGLTEQNSSAVYNSFLKSNIILYICVLAAAVAFEFVVHRNKKALI